MGRVHQGKGRREVIETKDKDRRKELGKKAVSRNAVSKGGGGQGCIVKEGESIIPSRKGSSRGLNNKEKSRN